MRVISGLRWTSGAAWRPGPVLARILVSEDIHIGLMQREAQIISGPELGKAESPQSHPSASINGVATYAKFLHQRLN